MWKWMLFALLALTACGSEIDTNCPYPDGVRIVHSDDTPEPEVIADKLRGFLADVGLNVVVTLERFAGEYLQDVEWKQRGQASTVYVGRDADATDWWTGLYIGGGVSLLDWTGRPDSDLRALTILHELGHSAGATHNGVVGDVMRQTPEQHDREFTEFYQRVGRVWFIEDDMQKMRECFE